MADGRVVLVVFDGLGFSRERCSSVANAAYMGLPLDVRLRLLQTCVGTISRAGAHIDHVTLAKLAMYPVWAEAVAPGNSVGDAEAMITLLQTVHEGLSNEDRETIATAVRATALEARYVPWAARMPGLSAIRNGNLSIPTQASGKWVGFEDLEPAVMGNSDTGHQQIGNLWVAPQTPLEISEAIESGAFFENPELLTAVERVRDSGNLNFCILLSGTGGSDGRVHSAWNHLEAFLELVFDRVGLPPDRVRIQAILDGRDSPGDSSTEKTGEIGDYLGQLETLLARYGAQSSLAWIVGRNIAMDRDYREGNGETDYRLLIEARGEVVRGFDGARGAIKVLHLGGLTDSELPPLVVTHGNDEPPVVQSGDSFIDLNFRADRQRVKIASLLGYREFLQREAESRGRTWGFDWMDDDLHLHICCMADYHPDLEAHSAHVAFPTLPQAGNFFAIYPKLSPDDRYGLVGESNKSAHVGYFIRGRREEPADGDIEWREIVPSAAEADGVESDADFYKTPGMRAREIARVVMGRVRVGEERMIACNFSNCDMIGHLLPGRFEAAVAACEAVDDAVSLLVDAAVAGGYNVVLTSDHGNVEEDNPAHSANEVLTTVVSEEIEAAELESWEARLFDIPWTIAELMGVSERLADVAAAIEGRPRDAALIGQSLVKARK